jgi:hypothetical protein
VTGSSQRLSRATPCWRGGTASELGERVLRVVLSSDDTGTPLSDDAARVLLAKWVGLTSVELPAESDALIVETGNLPLAISLAGARIADGARWGEVVDALQAGRLDYLDHPYGSVFASMQLSLDALTDDDRFRLLELAVFPEDVHVPVSVIERLWAQTGGLTDGEVGGLLEAFERKALLYVTAIDGRSSSFDSAAMPFNGGVSFHDLQHDFMRPSMDNLASTHGELVTAYWPDDADLPEIPVGERYMWGRRLRNRPDRAPMNACGSPTTCSLPGEVHNL